MSPVIWNPRYATFKFDIETALPAPNPLAQRQLPSLSVYRRTQCLGALYAREIAAACTRPVREQQVTLYELALTHDLSEIVTGDMPSPIKRALKAHFQGTQSPIDTLERAICPDAARLEDEAKQPEQAYLYRILKLADILDALVVINQEGKGSAREAISKERGEAFDELVAHASKEFPELNWAGAQEVRSLVSELKHVQLDEFNT